MSESKTKRRKPGAGRPTKPESEKMVLVAGKIPPEMLAAIEQIIAARDWTISTAVRVGCRLLIQQAGGKKNRAVNENVLTG